MFGTDYPMKHELIHINLSLAKYPLDSKEMQSFWALEAPINELARTYSGFTRNIDMPDRFSVFANPHVLNASGWKGITDLKEFVYTGMHATAMKDRKQWFTEHPHPKYVMFWVKAGETITEKLASEKMFLYAKNGASEEVFDFKNSYASPG